MRHELAQIACDGSLKLHERVLPLIAGLDDAPQARQAIAAWIAFVLRRQDTGEALRDPNADRIANLVEDNLSTRALCQALSGLIGLREASSEWFDALASEVVSLRA